jgi:crotonobetainyl-CoA:carnitine CoA-transferase CaiB-like acyl-CoA transferase
MVRMPQGMRTAYIRQQSKRTLMKQGHTGRGPLAGLRVLDVSIMAAGPWTAALLGMLGAEVIKVEPPVGDATRWALPTQNGMGTNFIAMNVNKKDITLDLKTPEGRAQAVALAERSDILVQNFRVGVIEKLGLGYETLKARNPRLIYCSISGFGDTGPLTKAGCADPIMQAFSGFGRLNGAPGQDVEAFRFTGFVDLATAAVAVEAILAALNARDAGGPGQEVKVSMLEAALEMQGTRVAEYLGASVLPKARGSEAAAFAPDRGYQSLDREVFVSVQSQAQWQAFCKAVEKPELAADARYATNTLRVEHRADIDAVVQPLFAKRPAIWWLRVFERGGVPCALGQHFDSFRHHHQVVANDMIATVSTPEWGEVMVAGLPWHFQGTPCEVVSSPGPGEHTAEILARLAQPDEGAGAAPVAAFEGLDSLRVLELAQGVAGPLAGMRLAQLGAKVTKVECGDGDWMRQSYPVRDGSGHSAAFEHLNRGKFSVALGSQPALAVPLLRKLVHRSDVVITDNTDEQLRALGLGELIDEGRPRRNRLIVVRITPWGRKGPMRHHAGSELTAQAMAGYTRYLGAHGEPACRLGADVGSVGTAAFATQAVLAALHARTMTGRGQTVDLCLWNSLLSMKSIHLAAQTNPDEYKGPRVGGANNPPELGWKTSDGRVFIQFGGSVGPTGRPGWEGFVKDVGLEKLLDDPRCDKTGRSSTGHGTYVHDYREIYEEAFSRFTAEEICDLVRKHGGNSAPYLRLDQTLVHPQSDAMQVLESYPDGAVTHRALRFPARFSALTPTTSRPAPALGADTEAVLKEAGMGRKAVAALRASGALAPADT